jgi:hypothetical protein
MCFGDAVDAIVQTFAASRRPTDPQDVSSSQVHIAIEIVPNYECLRSSSCAKACSRALTRSTRFAEHFALVSCRFNCVRWATRSDVETIVGPLEVIVQKQAARLSAVLESLHPDRINAEQTPSRPAHTKSPVVLVDTRYDSSETMHFYISLLTW